MGVIKIRTIHLPAIDRSVTLKQYIQAIKLAKANPDATFKHGLTCWWPCTGADIMKQFRESIHDRINQNISYILRGV
jgi:hypothetical protein